MHAKRLTPSARVRAQLTDRVVPLIPLVAAYPCPIACDIIDAIATLLGRLPSPVDCKAGLQQLVAPIVLELARFLENRDAAMASARERHPIGARALDARVR